MIRHGETEWTRSDQHTGRTDIPLTEHGKDEARGLAPLLRDIEFTRVLTSPAWRARQTCECAGLEKTSEIDPDLAEWDYGDYEGKFAGDIRKATPEWNVFRDGCPGGEMPGDVSERVDRLIARLRPLDGNIALFTHGKLGCIFAARWIGLSLAEGQHFALDTASLSIFGYERNYPNVPVISLLNYTPGS
jgi:probable phosphoglycerate mutase